MNEYLLPYLLLMAHFVSGGFWLKRITRKLEQQESTQQWIKFVSYLLLVNLLWCCLVWFHTIFPYLGLIIVLMASLEWWRVVKYVKNKIYLTFVFLSISGAFVCFLYMDPEILLFTYFVVVLFDGSSQVSGQLLGKRALLPAISPRKTIEGLLGGIIVTLATTLLVRHSFDFEWFELIFRSCMLMMAAFTGDMLASAVKRAAKVAAYGKLLPGHGGVLDRFDSLMMAGAFTFLLTELQHWIR